MRCDFLKFLPTNILNQIIFLSFFVTFKVLQRSTSIKICRVLDMFILHFSHDGHMDIII